MPEDPDLDEVSSQLEEISESLEELKAEPTRQTGQGLDEIAARVKGVADAVERAVDQE